VPKAKLLTSQKVALDSQSMVLLFVELRTTRMGVSFTAAQNKSLL